MRYFFEMSLMEMRRALLKIKIDCYSIAGKSCAAIDSVSSRLKVDQTIQLILRALDQTIPSTESNSPTSSSGYLILRWESFNNQKSYFNFSYENCEAYIVAIPGEKICLHLSSKITFRFWKQPNSWWSQKRYLKFPSHTKYMQ